MYYIGVDVGTGSVRAGIFMENGELVKVASSPVTTWNQGNGTYVQSTSEIWNSVSLAIHKITENIDKKRIKGIGFDATCSLAVFDDELKPMSVCPSGYADRNVILWMDHRAVKEADFVNTTGHDVLKYVGGKMSPEMEMPKLLWLKRNMKQSWGKLGKAFDLPDFLTWRATGKDCRSLCSLVCKWGYLCRSEEDCGWSAGFLTQIGLEDLCQNNYSKIGSTANIPGHCIEGGLSEEAAEQLGLLPGTAVATSIIDAHAGALGMLACNSVTEDVFEHRLGLICGTSSCHMALSRTPKFISGVWGPYLSAVLPGYWLNEAGQSASGKLIDHVIETHPAYAKAKSEAEASGLEIYKYLEDLAYNASSQNGESVHAWSRSLHAYPDFHGNRSPLADPDMKGMICGLTLGNGEEDLAKLYVATVQAVTYGTRHILESMVASGYQIDEIVMCGGLAKSQFFVQTHADVLQMPVILPRQSESMLLGSAMLARHAAGGSESIIAAATAMAGPADVVLPIASVSTYHDMKYKVYLDMLHLQRRARITMEQFGT